MSSIDQQFIEYIVKSLVGNPDAVSIERRIDEKGVLLELTVDPEDLGRVIGKRGATAQSLRTLLRALGTKNEARYNLKIVDNGEPRPPREDREDREDRSERHEDATPEAREEAWDQPAEEFAAAPAAAAKADDDDDFSDDDDTDTDTAPSDKFSRTRKELDDLDDLDI